MKSDDFTYLLWDRNHDGGGVFSADDKPTFMYWDNDNSSIGYLLDTRNMVNLNADFNTLKIGAPTMPASPTGVMYVNGASYFTDINVLADGTWPDYVFAANYELLPVKDLKKYIEEKKHLPNVPSAKEVEEEGIDVAEMNKVLLEKVEELTLYIINQSERLDQQAEEIEGLRKEIKEINESNQ